LNRIGLPEVRQFRLRKLDEEEREWTAALSRREQVFPELQPICVLFVEASNG
jgi:hypothetical protein